MNINHHHSYMSLTSCFTCVCLCIQKRVHFVFDVFTSDINVFPNAKTGWGMIRDTSAFVSPETHPYMLKACPNTLFLAEQGVMSEQINAGVRLPLSVAVHGVDFMQRARNPRSDSMLYCETDTYPHSHLR